MFCGHNHEYNITPRARASLGNMIVIQPSPAHQSLVETARRSIRMFKANSPTCHVEHETLEVES